MCTVNVAWHLCVPAWATWHLFIVPIPKYPYLGIGPYPNSYSLSSLKIWLFSFYVPASSFCCYLSNSARVPISWLPHKLKGLKTLGPLFLMTFPYLSVRVEFFASSLTVYILLSSSACCVTSRHYLPLPHICTKITVTKFWTINPNTVRNVTKQNESIFFHFNAKKVLFSLSSHLRETLYSEVKLKRNKSE
jgi:hypothetical protein